MPDNEYNYLQNSYCRKTNSETHKEIGFVKKSCVVKKSSNLKPVLE